MKNRIVAMMLSCTILSSFAPLSVFAFSQPVAVASDPVEPSPKFHGYDILGYDEEGNAILENDDYIAYFNSCLESRIAMLESGVAPINVFGDLVDKVTRFINFEAWANLQLDLGFRLAFGDNATDNGITEPEPKSEITIDKKVISYAKKTITYTRANAVETITLGAYLNLDSPGVSRITIARSGFGASSTFYMTPVEGSTGGITWSSSYYGIGGNWRASSSGSSGTRVIRIYGYSVNSLPNSDTTSTTLISDTNAIIVGSATSHADYAENTFQTNDYQYNANHTIIYNTNNYWQPMTYLSPIYAGDTINNNNINNYSIYGYYINPEGNVAFDPSVFWDWWNNQLKPELELLYKNEYDTFPEPGATYGDTDIVYDDPFDPETQPPATLPPGGVGGGLTPSELYGVLETETYYIADLETGLPNLNIESLPDVENLPADIVNGVGGISDFVVSILDSTGLLTIFLSLAVLAFIVFAFHG